MNSDERLAVEIRVPVRDRARLAHEAAAAVDREAEAERAARGGEHLPRLLQDIGLDPDLDGAIAGPNAWTSHDGLTFFVVLGDDGPELYLRWPCPICGGDIEHFVRSLGQVQDRLNMTVPPWPHHCKHKDAPVPTADEQLGDAVRRIVNEMTGA